MKNKKNSRFDIVTLNKKNSKSKRSAVLFTGGKDSCLALHIAKKEGYDVCYLLCVIPENFDSFMFHKPCFSLLEKQAEMLGINLLIMQSEGIAEQEVDDLKKLIRKVKNKVDVIIAGGIASGYQGEKVGRICKELGLGFYAPLWDFSPERIWKKLFGEGFEVILTKISCEGIGKEFLGRIIDEKMFEGLKKLSKKYKFRLDFEGGEAETAVLKMPEFEKEIEIRFDIKGEGEYRHWLNIKKVE